MFTRAAVRLIAGVSLACAVATFASVGGTLAADEKKKPEPNGRAALVSRARVWMPTNVSAMNLRRGPVASNGFAPGAIVTCDHDDKKLGGMSPKFACRIGKDDIVKVKYGGANGEVYGEVLASRLLWALGFPADRNYPVKVICRGCPENVGGILRENGDRIIDPAIIERKIPGSEIDEDKGWSWKELDGVDPRLGGARKAERDALKLLAVFLQHTDNKPQQQRLICLGATNATSCTRPFMMINDLGLTFGKASRFNENTPSGVNLADWSKTPVWKDEKGCVGNLSKSFTGTLEDPVISEEGRRFLANLLMKLTDRQLHDLFDAARVELRPRDPARGRSGFPDASEWVGAFKQKRSDIVNRRCA